MGLAAAPRPGTAPLPDPPERILAGDALVLLGWLATRRRPRRWATPAFAREVDLVRRHLAYVHGRATLAASFGREAFHVEPARGADGRTHGRGPARRGILAASPTRVAYALRWLELGDGRVRPPWLETLGSAPR